MHYEIIDAENTEELAAKVNAKLQQRVIPTLPSIIVPIRWECLGGMCIEHITETVYNNGEPCINTRRYYFQAMICRKAQ